MAEWTPEQRAMLPQLWDEGLTGTEIAFRLNKTKSQVIGLVHRMHLAPRRSPIGMKGGRQRASGTADRPKQPKPTPAKPLEAADRKPSGAPPAPAPIPKAPSAKTCQFPIGDPRKPGFHFCDMRPVMPGRPYCAAHCEIAYEILVRRPPRLDAEGKPVRRSAAFPFR